MEAAGELRLLLNIKGPDGALRGVQSKNKHTHTHFSLNDSLKYSASKGQSPLEHSEQSINQYSAQ